MRSSHVTRRWGGPVVLAALVLTLTVGWWSKSRCIADGDWTDGEQYHGYCYSDIVALWGVRQLADGAVPYVDAPLEYPVVLGGVMWLTAAVARAGPGVASAADYLDVNAVLIAALVLLTAALARRTGVVLPAVAWWAGLPLLALGAFINWDAVPIALLAGAIWCHRRDRDVAAGVLVGLGTAAKLYPGFLLPLVVLGRLRQGRPGDAWRHVAAAIGTWLAVNVPVASVAPDGWYEFFELNRERGGHIDSLWYAVDRLGGPTLAGTTLNLAASGAFLLGAVLLVAIGLRRRPAGGEWALIAPVVAWFLVTNKVYSPQYSLWLAALLLLTLRRAAPFVVFALSDVAVHLTEFSVLGGRAGFEPAPGEGWLVLTTVIRAAALVWVIASSLRHPLDEPAPVRREGGAPSDQTEAPAVVEVGGWGNAGPRP